MGPRHSRSPSDVGTFFRNEHALLYLVNVMTATLLTEGVGVLCMHGTEHNGAASGKVEPAVCTSPFAPRWSLVMLVLSRVPHGEMR